MSFLTEILPDYIIVSGEKCKINTDFKTWLKFSEIISGNDFNAESILLVFKNIFLELPPNLIDALKAIIQFYARKNEGQTKEPGEKLDTKRYFDFEYDADLIFSAFMQQYNIDLCEVDMHWWKFKALLSGLSEDTHFIKVIQFRSADLSKIKDREQKKFYMEMKARYRLPDNRSEVQKELQLDKAISRMF